MEGLSKSMIDSAFEEVLAKACFENRTPMLQMTLAVRIVEKGKMLLQLCRKSVPQKELEISSLLNIRMVGLRFTARHIEKLFRTVHNAFMMETKQENPARISLLLYHSEAVHCPCIGVLQDEKPVKVLTVSDIIQAVEMESEQLN